MLQGADYFPPQMEYHVLPVTVTIYMCVLPLSDTYSMAQAAWRGRGWWGLVCVCVCVCVWVCVGGWGFTHRAAMNMTPRYFIVGPCPVPWTFDSISASGINVSLGSTFWIIGAVCRHPATSCQQHRLSVCLSVLSHSSTHALTLQKTSCPCKGALDTFFYYYQTVPIITP